MIIELVIVFILFGALGYLLGGRGSEPSKAEANASAVSKVVTPVVGVLAALFVFLPLLEGYMDSQADNPGVCTTNPTFCQVRDADYDGFFTFAYFVMAVTGGYLAGSIVRELTSQKGP